jgi:hypothetical protein
VPEFDIVDLTGAATDGPETARWGATGQGLTIGRVDSADIAASLNAIRQDISAHLEAPDDGLGLSQLVIRLTLSAEGKVAFVAKGAAEACFEVTFAARR